MASYDLYPPIVNSYAPSFVTWQTIDTATNQPLEGNKPACNIYFSLSKFNVIQFDSSIKLHAVVTYQSDATSAVNKEDSNIHYRKTGIILNMGWEKTSQDGVYVTKILNEDIKGTDTAYPGFSGFIPGRIYSIQLRFSKVEYDPTTYTKGQQAWISENASNFSEWSTIVVTKAIGQATIRIPSIGYYTGDSTDTYTVNSETIEVLGKYYNIDESETLRSYRVSLYKGNVIDQSMKIEDSDIIYASKFYDVNQIKYKFKTALVNGTTYTVGLQYTTINYYESGEIAFKVKAVFGVEENPLTIETIDYSTDAKFKTLTDRGLEEDEGRVCLHIGNLDAAAAGTYVVRRADSRIKSGIHYEDTDESNEFTMWDTIQTITLPFVEEEYKTDFYFFDNTAESGVWYKYGIQQIEDDGSTKSSLNKTENPILRNYEYAYLYDADGRQLKIPYDYTVSNYSVNVQESITDTIGGKYPFITRTGGTRNKTFSIGGIISFNMDDNNTFTSREKMYGSTVIAGLYDDYNTENRIDHYDHIREREFRNLVIEFLMDGKRKVYKSTQEGNMIVRLTNVSLSPNAQLGRLTYNFSATVTEIADYTVENLTKYGFCDTLVYCNTKTAAIAHPQSHILSADTPEEV